MFGVLACLGMLSRKGGHSLRSSASVCASRMSISMCICHAMCNKKNEGLHHHIPGDEKRYL